jgi:histone-lysine N-methyltransferase EZH2
VGVAKHRFVGEYRGEVISHEEADRRGSIYDFRNVSFLFNLSDARVVDATRAGNKLKYANHAGEGEGGGGSGGGGGEQRANLYPRIVLSQGELRIGMFARRKIMPGDELLFNYHWTHESAWTSNARRKQQQQLQQQPQ